MLTILTVLESYADDMFLKIGTEEGGWFYLGTVKDYKERYSEIDDIVKKYNEDLLNRVLKTILFIIHHPPEKVEDRTIWDEAITGYFYNLQIKANLYERHQNNLENYVDISNRPVVSAFIADQIITENCVNIVVVGKERGRYWDHSEAPLGSVCFFKNSAPFENIEDEQEE